MPLGLAARCTGLQASTSRLALSPASSGLPSKRGYRLSARLAAVHNPAPEPDHTPSYKAPRTYTSPQTPYRINYSSPASYAAPQSPKFNPAPAPGGSPPGLPSPSPPPRFWAYQSPRAYQAPTSDSSRIMYASPTAYGPANGGGAAPPESSGGRGEGAGGPLKMSQIVTLVYAGLLTVGGFIGFLKSGSKASLAAGAGSAALLGVAAWQLGTQPKVGSLIGLVVSGALTSVMGLRFLKSGKIFPAGAVFVLSGIMVVGYIHGLLRQKKLE